MSQEDKVWDHCGGCFRDFAAVLVVDECCASGWTSVFGGQLGMDRISELAQSMGKEQRNVTGDDWVGET